jgi:type II secretory pathway pseudopilin PulG
MSSIMFRSRPGGRPTGFILLELIIVLFLMSVILGLSAIFFASSLPGYRLNATVRNISTTIKQARAFAKMMNEKQVVTIDLENRQYTLEGHDPKDIPPDIAVKVVDPVEGEIIEGRYHIIVHTTGGVEGGTIVLWNARKTISIQIDPIIGTVRIQ